MIYNLRQSVSHTLVIVSLMLAYPVYDDMFSLSFWTWPMYIDAVFAVAVLSTTRRAIAIKHASREWQLSSIARARITNLWMFRGRAEGQPAAPAAWSCGPSPPRRPTGTGGASGPRAGGKRRDQFPQI